MTYLGVSGMQYSGEQFPEARIIVAEDSNVFTSMIRQRLKEIVGIDAEICRTYEDLMMANELSEEPVTLAISNINLPGAENGEALEYLLDLNIPTVVFTGTFQEHTGKSCSPRILSTTS